MNDNDTMEMTIAIHNPASFTVTGTSIAVPDSNFSVWKFNEPTGAFI